MTSVINTLTGRTFQKKDTFRSSLPLRSLRAAALLAIATAVHPAAATAQTPMSGKSIGPVAQDVPSWMITTAPPLPASVSPLVLRASLNDAASSIEAADLALAVASEAAALHDPQKTAAALDAALKALADFGWADQAVAAIAHGKLAEAVDTSKRIEPVPLFLTFDKNKAGDHRLMTNPAAASTPASVEQADIKTLANRVDAARKTVIALQVLVAQAEVTIAAPGSPGEMASLAEAKRWIDMAHAVARDALAHERIDAVLAHDDGAKTGSEMARIKQEEKAGTMIDPKKLTAYQTAT